METVEQLKGLQRFLDLKNDRKRSKTGVTGYGKSSATVPGSLPGTSASTSSARYLSASSSFSSPGLSPHADSFSSLARAGDPALPMRDLDDTVSYDMDGMTYIGMVLEEKTASTDEEDSFSLWKTNYLQRFSLRYVLMTSMLLWLFVVYTVLYVIKSQSVDTMPVTDAEYGYIMPSLMLKAFAHIVVMSLDFGLYYCPDLIESGMGMNLKDVWRITGYLVIGVNLSTCVAEWNQFLDSSIATSSLVLGLSVCNNIIELYVYIYQYFLGSFEWFCVATTIWKTCVVVFRYGHLRLLTMLPSHHYSAVGTWARQKPGHVLAVTFASAAAFAAFIHHIHRIFQNKVYHKSLQYDREAATNEAAIQHVASELQLTTDLFARALDSCSALLSNCSQRKKIAFNRVLAKIETFLGDVKIMQNDINFLLKDGPIGGKANVDVDVLWWSSLTRQNLIRMLPPQSRMRWTVCDSVPNSFKCNSDVVDAVLRNIAMYTRLLFCDPRMSTYGYVSIHLSYTEVKDKCRIEGEGEGGDKREKKKEKRRKNEKRHRNAGLGELVISISLPKGLATESVTGDNTIDGGCDEVLLGGNGPTTNTYNAMDSVKFRHPIILLSIKKLAHSVGGTLVVQHEQGADAAVKGKGDSESSKGGTMFASNASVAIGKSYRERRRSEESDEGCSASTDARTANKRMPDGRSRGPYLLYKVSIMVASSSRSNINSASKRNELPLAADSVGHKWLAAVIHALHAEYLIEAVLFMLNSLTGTAKSIKWTTKSHCPAVTTVLGMPVFCKDAEHALHEWRTRNRISSWRAILFADSQSTFFWFTFRLYISMLCRMCYKFLFGQYALARKELISSNFVQNRYNCFANVSFLLMCLRFVPGSIRLYLTNGWLDQRRVWTFLGIVILLLYIYQLFIAVNFDREWKFHSSYTTEEFETSNFGLNFASDSYRQYMILLSVWFVHPFFIMCTLPWPLAWIIILVTCVFNVVYLCTTKDIFRNTVIFPIMMCFIIIFSFIMSVLHVHMEYGLRFHFQSLVDSTHKRKKLDNLLGSTSSTSKDLTEQLLLYTRRLSRQVRVLVAAGDLVVQSYQVGIWSGIKSSTAHLELVCKNAHAMQFPDEVNESVINHWLSADMPIVCHIGRISGLIERLATVHYRPRGFTVTLQVAQRCTAVFVHRSLGHFIFSALELAHQKMIAPNTNNTTGVYARRYDTRQHEVLSQGTGNDNKHYHNSSTNTLLQRPMEIIIKIDEAEEASFSSLDESTRRDGDAPRGKGYLDVVLLDTSEPQHDDVRNDPFLVPKYLLTAGLAAIGGQYLSGRAADLIKSANLNLQRLTCPIANAPPTSFPSLRPHASTHSTESMIRVGTTLGIVENSHASFVRGSNLRVLLLEADTTMSHISAHILHLEGWDCAVVSSYPELTKRFTDDGDLSVHEDWDVILIDAEFHQSTCRDYKVDLSMLLPTIGVICIAPYEGYTIPKPNFFDGCVFRPFNKTTVTRIIYVLKRVLVKDMF